MTEYNLHVDFLEKHIDGSVSLEIIESTYDKRRAYLIDNNARSWTYAGVLFLNYNQPSIHPVHCKIIGGELLGRTLSQSKIKFKKCYIGSIKIQLPVWLKKEFQTDSNAVVANYSRILIESTNEKKETFIYAELIEVIRPDLNDFFKFKFFTDFDDDINKLLNFMKLKPIKDEGI